MWKKEAIKSIRYLSGLRSEIDNLIADIQCAISDDNEELYTDVKDDIEDL